MSTSEPSHPVSAAILAALPDRSLGDRANADPIRVERRWLPSRDGAIERPVVYTNVPHHAVYDADVGFDFSAAGPGAEELALNVIEDVLRHGGYAGAGACPLHGSCFLLSRTLAPSFAGAFLVHLPTDGGELAVAGVQDWVDDAVAALDPETAAALCARYAPQGPRLQSIGAGWSAAELSAILDTPLDERPDGLYDSVSGDRIAIAITSPHPVGLRNHVPPRC